MKAMILEETTLFSQNKTPLKMVDIPVPSPKENEVLIKVSACGVCHTELDEIEGRITSIKLPVVLGHQVVGTIEKAARESTKFKIGDRVGVAWVFDACGKCKFCKAGLENLCSDFKATGLDTNGGYAEYMVAPKNHVYHIPNFFSDIEAAPLLCAGAIGYRSIRLSNLIDGDNLGLTGFGASAHLVLKMVRFKYPKTKVYVFARAEEERKFAIKLGAFWAGDTLDSSPQKLDCIIDTTPVWTSIVEALSNLEKGGRLVINAIRKENHDQNYLQKLNYKDHLWQEKEIKSVANVTGKDVAEFLDIAAKAKIKPEVQCYKLDCVNEALVELKEQYTRGAKVLQMV